MPVLLGEKDVRAVLSMDDLIAAMETALDQYSGGGVRQPLRSVVDVGDGHAFYGVMPAYIRQPPALDSFQCSRHRNRLHPRRPGLRRASRARAR